MAVAVIPLVAVPSQTLTTMLGQTPVRLRIRQRRTGLFVDVLSQDVPVIEGVKALDRTKIVRAAYRGFPGDLFFVDTQGTTDPAYDGLGTRYLLLWQKPA